MRSLLALLLTFSTITLAFAGEAENISACAKKTKEFAGVILDPFDARYEGKVLSMSTAKWSNAFCEVKLGVVYTLQVNDKTFIYEGFAGKDSYDLNVSLQAKTEDAIKQMRSRIALLEKSASQVSISLRRPNPDHKLLTRYVDDGIRKSLGYAGPSATINSARNAPATVEMQNVEMVSTPSIKSAQLEPAIQMASQNEPSKLMLEIPIPRSMPGDKGKYYLLEAKKENGLIKTLHKRVGVDSIGYTRAEINCHTMQIRETGYSEIAPAAIKESVTEWYDLVGGSSKSDLVNFVCAG